MESLHSLSDENSVPFRRGHRGGLRPEDHAITKADFLKVSYGKLNFPWELSIYLGKCFRAIRKNGIWYSFHIFRIC